MTYHLLKTIHILSATIMIGTGLGSAFYLFLTYKQTSINTFKEVLNLVVIADLIFTTPSVIIQLITGIYLTKILNLTDSIWYILVLSIGFGVLILWLGAVFIQYRLKNICKLKTISNQKIDKLMNYWFYLGVPSFLLSIYLYYLMIYKPFI